MIHYQPADERLTDKSTFIKYQDQKVNKIPGVSEKSDEFITCIFRVVLGIECRIGYQVKAYSKIFCLSGNPPHLLTLTEPRWAHIRDDPLFARGVGESGVKRTTGAK